MNFFTFRQNNSGGSFVVDSERGIGYMVCIEAENAEKACERAREIGLYFNGRGDCSCCGPRWSEVDDDDALPYPGVYGRTLWAHKPFFDVPSFIHYAVERTIVRVDHDGTEPAFWAQICQVYNEYHSRSDAAQESA